MSAPSLLDRVRARLAVEDAMPSRAGVAALVREEAGGLMGDADVLLAVRDAVDELAGAGPLEALLRLPGGPPRRPRSERRAPARAPIRGRATPGPVR